MDIYNECFAYILHFKMDFIDLKDKFNHDFSRIDGSFPFMSRTPLGTHLHNNIGMVVAHHRFYDYALSMWRKVTAFSAACYVRP